MTSDTTRTVITPVAGRDIPADAWAAYKAGVRDGKLTRDDAATVLDALAVAADHKREIAAHCPECDASPSDLCPDCETRLERAQEYDQLAARLRSES